jgi:tetraacyldisaccharide 4'-kinase
MARDWSKTWSKIGPLNILLWPLSFIYRIGVYNHLSMIRPIKIDDIEVICVGNAVAGGAGKTPLAIYLAKLLQEYKVPVALLSAGYKGKKTASSKSFKVDPKVHTYEDFGDEALLLAEAAPTYVAPNRYLSATQAKEEGINFMIMDDGLQNRTLMQHLRLLTVNGSYGFGNGLIMPAGPLREALDYTVKRAHAVCLIGKPNPKLAKQLLSLNKPIIRFSVVVSNQEEITESKYVLLCGIANPERFQRQVKEMGKEVTRLFSFPDHHAFTSVELERVYSYAASVKQKVLTTAKDLTRIPKEYHPHTHVVKIEYHCHDKEALLELIANGIHSFHYAKPFVTRKSKGETQ